MPKNDKIDTAPLVEPPAKALRTDPLTGEVTEVPIAKTDPVTGEVVGGPEAPAITEPNVIWVGPGEPHEYVNAAPATIVLPDAATQRAGFYSPQAGVLVESVKGFKRFIPGSPKLKE